MLGSNLNISCPNTILNTIVAEELTQFADELECVKQEDMTKALIALIQKTLKNHKRIIFSGNGYSDEWKKEAQKRGIADKKTVMKRSKWFMIPFCIIIFVALILIISVWNHVTDLKTAYLQSCLFLVVMNWFDGIVIDRLWVGHSKIWHIEGMEGIPYVKSWKTVLIKLGVATVLYLVVALVVAEIVVLLGKI